MRASDSLVGGGAGQFHTTRWTLVIASAHNQSQIGQAALAALCQIYWYPLYTFARRHSSVSAFVGRVIAVAMNPGQTAIHIDLLGAKANC